MSRQPLVEKPINTVKVRPKSGIAMKSRMSQAGKLALASTTANTGANGGSEESLIKVYVRCRPRNERELQESSAVVVSTATEGLERGKELSVSTGKTYAFDGVFGPEADQDMVFEGAVAGLVGEVIQGYNCTVFAYGQTGTGKTYTMLEGVVPRVVERLFAEVKDLEFAMKVSFVELYNEELRDLLGSEEEAGNRKVRIFEENGSVNVSGMEEVFVRNAEEGLKALKDGTFRRQVASTKCNDRSSRSHSVFTITLHMKQTTVEGQEYVKTGKFNLVDLAGSENIGRSGAQDMRAREAGMINQSLLTLGRVINALVERSPHIPYRESKLTRVLQDSLGGRTKTCIIATISPAKVSLDETLSTLDYANRAKSIKNRPKVNQTLSKQVLIADYIREIERLRNDLVATREKNGVYMSQEGLTMLESQNESRKVQIEEQKLRLEVLEDQNRRLKKSNEELTAKNEQILKNLDEKEQELKNTQVSSYTKTMIFGILTMSL